MFIEDIRIATIPTASIDEVVSHSTTAVKVTYYNNNGTMKGVDKFRHPHWFHMSDIIHAQK